MITITMASWSNYYDEKPALEVKKLAKTKNGACNIKNNRTSHCWSSRFLLITLTVLFGKAITITAQNATNSKVSPPLGISTNDLFLKIGKSAQIVITPTSNFEPVFQNASTSLVVLVFHEVPIDSAVIEPVENITLLNGTGSVPTQTNYSLTIVARQAGKVTVTSDIVPEISKYKPTNIFVRVSVYKFETLQLLSYIVGWIYFAAWSISFYPQIIQNYQRKSVRGLSLDFVFLNITGFTVYGVYNIGLYWVGSVQEQYYNLHPQGIIPVELNDVIFTLHAIFACGITVFQCLIYDRGSQAISHTGKMLLCTILVFIFVIFVVAISQAITWLTFLTWCSYVKLVITLIKYMPQAYLNWYRKSTSGWSIGNVLLDFTGGIFSLTQMIFIIYNHNDWSLISGDLTKFGLGLFSILFDIFFIIQHYVLYRNHAEYEPIEGGDSPIEPNQYGGDITTSNHHGASGSVDEATEIEKSSSIIDYRIHSSATTNYEEKEQPSSSDVAVNVVNANTQKNETERQNIREANMTTVVAGIENGDDSSSSSIPEGDNVNSDNNHGNQNI